MSRMEYFESHPTLEMIELYILGSLHLRDQQELAKHLSGCEPCQVMTARLQEQIDVIRESMLVA